MNPMAPEKERKPKINRKAAIVAAAEHLLRERGLSGVTTRAIAEAVPCSEGAIYVHFSSRLEVLMAVLEQALPEMLEPLAALEEKAGKSTPAQNLLVAVQGLQRFHDRVAPMLSSLFAEPELLKRFRDGMEGRMKGPRGGIGRMARYLAEEQKLGRVPEHVAAETVASTLMAASFFRAFSLSLTGQTLPGLSPRSLIEALLR